MSDKYIAWCDTETTDLENGIPDGAKIVEIYVRITDQALRTVGEFHSLVCDIESASLFEGWVQTWKPIIQKMKTENGLLEELRAGKGRPTRDVEQDLVAFLRKHHKGTPKSLMLAGNTIKFDWTFLQACMPAVLDQVHYRTLDVSSTRVQLEGLFPGTGWAYLKQKGHRAAADIDETIAEYKWLWEKAAARFHNSEALPWE